MEDFYDKIRDKMNDAPKVPTDWEMWDGIESSMDWRKKNRFLPVLLGLPFLLLLSGIIGYLLAPKPESRTTDNLEVIRDTIYLTESIHTVDTILQKEYITRWKYKSPNEKLAFQSQMNQLSDLNASLSKKIDGLNKKLDNYRYAFTNSILKDDPIYRDLDFFKTDSENSFLTSDIVRNNDRSTIDAFRMSPLLDFELLEYEREKPMLIHNLLFENLVKNKQSESFLKQLVPDYINVGASVETPGLAFTNNLNPGLEAGFGLNVELLFSPRFSLVTGIRSRSTRNKTVDIDIASTFPQPVIGLEDVFKNLNVKSSFLDVPIAFKYKMLKLRNNDVYLTGGVLISKQKEREYIYEYIRNTSEVYYEEKDSGTGWTLGSSIIGVGYEFEPWTRTSAFIESYARYNFSSDFDAIHGVGFRFGMYYKI